MHLLVLGVEEGMAGKGVVGDEGRWVRVGLDGEAAPVTMGTELRALEHQWREGKLMGRDWQLHDVLELAGAMAASGMGKRGLTRRRGLWPYL